MPDGRDDRVVLIVEDQHLIRLMVADAFEEAGFTVFEAATADHAITVLQREPTIHVVFTDIDLPGTMDGVALAHYVRRRWPPTILYVSSGRVALDAIRLPSKAEFVPKPYLDRGPSAPPDPIGRRGRAELRHRDALAERHRYDPVTVRVKAATLTIDTVEQFFLETRPADKVAALVRVIESERPGQAIVFVRTKIRCEQLFRTLRDPRRDLIKLREQRLVDPPAVHQLRERLLQRQRAELSD